MADSADLGRSPVGAPDRWLRGAAPGLRVAAAAAAPPGTPLRDRLPEITLGVRSWSAAQAAAREPRLDGFVAHWIWTSSRGLVPADMLPKLEARLFALARRERLLLAEQRAIRSALAVRGIASLPYRGPSLAGRLYEPSFLRYSRDLDILVPPERVDEAIRSLEADYEAIREHAEGGSEDETEHHQLIHHRESGVLVEVHGSLAPARWGLATDALVGPPGTWPPADAGPEDGWSLPRLLPVVAAHGVRHG
ncbi:MAG: nucleotidyltransferase family protein [Deltaproteobacteria bacterium]|nr:nucleotidyltransferase family protein [Deltaproteobacteria bacterium]